MDDLQALFARLECLASNTCPDCWRMVGRRRDGQLYAHERGEEGSGVYCLYAEQAERDRRPRPR